MLYICIITNTENYLKQKVMTQLKKQVIAKLIKSGHNPVEAKKMVDAGFETAVKASRSGKASDIAKFVSICY